MEYWIERNFEGDWGYAQAAAKSSSLFTRISEESRTGGLFKRGRQGLHARPANTRGNTVNITNGFMRQLESEKNRQRSFHGEKLLRSLHENAAMGAFDKWDVLNRTMMELAEKTGAVERSGFGAGRGYRRQARAALKEIIGDAKANGENDPRKECGGLWLGCHSDGINAARAKAQKQITRATNKRPPDFETMERTMKNVEKVIGIVNELHLASPITHGAELEIARRGGKGQTQGVGR